MTEHQLVHGAVPLTHFAQLKLDMEVRGTMLLRNTADDTIWVLQTEMLEQVRRN
jgi:hypothetical protein